MGAVEGRADPLQEVVVQEVRRLLASPANLEQECHKAFAAIHKDGRVEPQDLARLTQRLIDKINCQDPGKVAQLGTSFHAVKQQGALSFPTFHEYVSSVLELLTGAGRASDSPRPKPTSKPRFPGGDLSPWSTESIPSVRGGFTSLLNAVLDDRQDACSIRSLPSVSTPDRPRTPASFPGGLGASLGALSGRTPFPFLFSESAGHRGPNLLGVDVPTPSATDAELSDWEPDSVGTSPGGARRDPASPAAFVLSPAGSAPPILLEDVGALRPPYESERWEVPPVCGYLPRLPEARPGQEWTFERDAPTPPPETAWWPEQPLDLVVFVFNVRMQLEAKQLVLDMGREFLTIQDVAGSHDVRCLGEEQALLSDASADPYAAFALADLEALHLGHKTPVVQYVRPVPPASVLVTLRFRAGALCVRFCSPADRDNLVRRLCDAYPHLPIA